MKLGKCQFDLGKFLDQQNVTMCFKLVNAIFKGSSVSFVLTIGLPQDMHMETSAFHYGADSDEDVVQRISDKPNAD